MNTLNPASEKKIASMSILQRTDQFFIHGDINKKSPARLAISVFFVFNETIYPTKNPQPNVENNDMRRPKKNFVPNAFTRSAKMVVKRGG